MDLTGLDRVIAPQLDDPGAYARLCRDRALLPVAGGTWLLGGAPTAHPPGTAMLDLRAAGWPDITVAPDGLRISATCPIGSLIDPSRAGASLPDPVRDMLRACADSMIASFKVLDSASVGGNLCLGLPLGGMIAGLAALRAECLLWHRTGQTERVHVAHFADTPGRMALSDGALLREIFIPQDGLHHRFAVEMLRLPPGRRLAAMVIAGPDAVTVSAATARPVMLPPDAPEDAIAALPVTGTCADHRAWQIRVISHLAGIARRRLRAGP